jgi:hypothetical protein
MYLNFNNHERLDEYLRSHSRLRTALSEWYYSNIKSITVLLAGDSMAASPAQEPSGWEENPAWLDRDPMTAAEREAWLDRLCAQDDDPADAPQEYWDPESCAPPPGQDELTADELAEVRAAAADEMLALDAASTGRRGAGAGRLSQDLPG